MHHRAHRLLSNAEGRSTDKLKVNNMRGLEVRRAELNTTAPDCFFFGTDSSRVLCWCLEEPTGNIWAFVFRAGSYPRANCLAVIDIGGAYEGYLSLDTDPEHATVPTTLSFDGHGRRIFFMSTVGHIRLGWIDIRNWSPGSPTGCNGSLARVHVIDRSCVTRDPYTVGFDNDPGAHSDQCMTWEGIPDPTNDINPAFIDFSTAHQLLAVLYRTRTCQDVPLFGRPPEEIWVVVFSVAAGKLHLIERRFVDTPGTSCPEDEEVIPIGLNIIARGRYTIVWAKHARPSAESAQRLVAKFISEHPQWPRRALLHADLLVTTVDFRTEILDVRERTSSTVRFPGRLPVYCKNNETHGDIDIVPSLRWIDATSSSAPRCTVFSSLFPNRPKTVFHANSTTIIVAVPCNASSQTGTTLPASALIPLPADTHSPVEAYDPARVGCVSMCVHSTRLYSTDGTVSDAGNILWNGFALNILGNAILIGEDQTVPREITPYSGYPPPMFLSEISF